MLDFITILNTKWVVSKTLPDVSGKQLVLRFYCHISLSMSLPYIRSTMPEQNLAKMPTSSFSITDFFLSYLTLTRNRMYTLGHQGESETLNYMLLFHIGIELK